MRQLKAVVVALAAFVFFLVIFNGPLDMKDEQAFFGALAATVLAVFLWKRLASKFNL